VTDPIEPGPPSEPPSEPSQRQESLLWRVVRSAIAPDVLEDGGQDAPLSRRGRLVFWGTVGVLVAGIAVVLLITLARR
jgi:hypothetical protein